MREPRAGERTTADQKPYVRERLNVLASLRVRTWAKALAISAGAAFVIGLPTRLIPNPFFIRMIPTTPVDYVIYGIAISLIGLTWALPVRVPAARAERSSIVGGIGTFFKEMTRGA